MDENPSPSRKVIVIRVVFVTSTDTTEIEDVDSPGTIKAIIYTHVLVPACIVRSPDPHPWPGLLQTGLTAQIHTPEPKRQRHPSPTTKQR